ARHRALTRSSSVPNWRLKLERRDSPPWRPPDAGIASASTLELPPKIFRTAGLPVNQRRRSSSRRLIRRLASLALDVAVPFALEVSEGGDLCFQELCQLVDVGVAGAIGAF